MVDKKFKDKYTFEERLKEARKKKEEHPTLIPVIVERHARSKLPEIEKSKFLASKEMKLQEFQASIKKKLKLDKSEALFFFIAGKKIDRPDTPMQDVYNNSKDKDEFLYITYSELEAFGSY
eukprot:CAMPEP_0176454646 /NCGR_PEP_ID=MMETSP0127-20121128/30096_1 /TAXON_ID=938130 /ORGANISM="Platyophrya macrostoma, Strain WH" /LENGTH=120 /DNA_ID=CAMNT_0017844013 /DNA_START=30 /DNA_END=392 /DNA_ORIENTATION=+